MDSVSDALKAISPSLPHPSALFHSTEWISRSLQCGFKCSDESCRLPSPKIEEEKATDTISHISPSKHHEDTLLRRKPSGDSLATSSDQPMLSRKSSSKTKYEALDFSQPGFGMKTKSQLKKRGRENGESEGEEERVKEAKRRSEKEAQEDSFARHLIRKKVKYSEFLANDVEHKFKEEEEENAPKEVMFDLVYEEEEKSEDEEGAAPWSLVAQFEVPKALRQLKKEREVRKKGEEWEEEKEEREEGEERKKKIWFTGSPLPRALEGVRATKEDDMEDPKFYELLKPVEREGEKERGEEEEERYLNPWAHRYKERLNEALREIEEAEEFGALAEEGKREEDEKEEKKKKGKLLIVDSDSDENDFSESQVQVDERDFGKNFGHSERPLSAYWERQKANLACQKKPLSKALESEHNSSPSSSLSSSIIPKEKVNHNKLVTDHLEKLEKICLGSGDRWRGYAYRKAANILKGLGYNVGSKEEAMKLRGIGKSIAEKIGEIISTGKLRKLEALQGEERIQILSTFMGIFGVGQSTANKWMSMGYKTLEDLEKNASLTYAQAVGLKFYNEFQLRIPREEMERICGKIKGEIRKIDEDFVVEICGSYRRGKLDCGDIDLIITHKRPSSLKNILLLSIPKLHEAGILTHDFVSISHGSDKYMGVCQASPSEPHRRIDILTVSPSEWPFALLYFTGSGHFNRSMRFWAGKRGYSLSQHGLRVNYGNDNKGPYIAGISTELQIFQALGLEYRPPQDRDV